METHKPISPLGLERKNIVSQIYPEKYCFVINLRFISQGELKKTLIFKFHKNAKYNEISHYQAINIKIPIHIN